MNFPRILAVAALASASLFAVSPARARTECPVSFFVEELAAPVALAHVAFDIRYTPPAVVFTGSGAAVECSSPVANAQATFDDDDGGTVEVALDSEQGIPTLFQLLAVCAVRMNAAEDAAGITVTEVVETDTQGQPAFVPVQILLPTPDDCTALATTTLPPVTTTSTSTTSIVTSTTSTTTTLASPACGDPVSDDRVTASDALFVLQAAVGAAACVDCVCDANASGQVTASDALRVLNFAVGQPVSLDCPAC